MSETISDKRMQLFFRILLLILLSVSVLYPQDTSSFRKRFESFLAGNPYLEKSSIAVEIYDLSSHTTLYSLNNKLLLHPASNMKLLTSAAGLLFLQDYSFETSLLYTGEIVNGILLGDLYIKGGCDPAFTLNDLDTLVTSLKLMGILEINGSIYGDVSFKDNQFWGRGWMWDDDPSADAPYLSALNINYNTVTVVASSALNSDTLTVRTEPPSSYFTINNNAVISFTDDKDSLYVTRNWINRSNDISIYGTVNVNDTSKRIKVINVYSPEDYFLTLFKERLNSHLITFSGNILVKNIPPFAQKLKTIRRSLDSILSIINKASNNLTAEMVLYALAEKHYGEPASAKNGLLMIDSLIKITGLDPSDYRLADGSGVSHYNLVSAELLLSVLKYLFYQQPHLYNKLFNSLAIAGVDGTLRNRMKGTSAAGKIYGKSGTLTGVSCLTGYAETASGNMAAFSILIQNFSGDSGYAKYLQDEICKLIAEY